MTQLELGHLELAAEQVRANPRRNQRDVYDAGRLESIEHLFGTAGARRGACENTAETFSAAVCFWWLRQRLLQWRATRSLCVNFCRHCTKEM